MLSEEEFRQWCDRLNLPESTRKVVQDVRSSNPSRRVLGSRVSVTGFYSSRKMGLTIQFESHRNELARIYELEHDPDVLEYYDQPPPIELIYQAKSGRENRHLYTPDFFIIRVNSAGWEECKTEQELTKLSQDSPNRYSKQEDERWHCPPGEEFAARIELSFNVWSDAEISWISQRNFVWLEDYIGLEPSSVFDEASQAVVALIKAKLGITLAELLQQADGFNADDVYTLIVTDQLYVDLARFSLAEPETVRIFLNKELALAFERTTEIHPSTIPISLQNVQISVGSSLLWDSELWEVINTGITSTALLRSDGKLIELPNSAIDKLISEGKISSPIIEEIIGTKAEIEEILRRARPEDTREANRRYEIIQPYLGKNPPPRPSSTIRRWRDSFRKAEGLYGNGYIGLFPRNQEKGNYSPKVDDKSHQFMLNFIERNYENSKNRRILRVYESYVEACSVNEPPFFPLSRTTFSQAINKRDVVNKTLKREGRRAAIQKEEFYWELEITTPRHGSRPFEIVHVDHTELDVELVSSIQSLATCSSISISDVVKHNLGRPWATFMTDAFDRRLLAVYLTYEEPSYRSCMMVLRICVQRFRRFPQIIVVDNGAEFHSHYFEQLIAYHYSTKKHRPVAKARYGSVLERLFGVANTQFVHELTGNTQIMKKHRQVTKSVNPKNLAIWTLDELYESLCEWAYKIYDKREHPALGKSPRDAFKEGIALGGSRSHRRVEYDEAFRMLTLPAPDGGKRKVQPGYGIKIHNIYYWSNAFRDPQIEKSSVEVRYDPFDAGTAYALVQGQWVQCISNYYQYLQGRSEKEIRLASADLRKRKLSQGQKTIETDKELIQFLNSVEAKEGRLLQEHLKAAENRHVLQILETGFNENGDPIDSEASFCQSIEIASQSNLILSSETDISSHETDISNNVVEGELESDGDDVDGFVFYGEF
uniref:Mu transposase C-terminal domain-containing protein n=1 Tax=Trichocoleus desertorum TaxID=1481672 RepID=UPI0025B4AE61|nr:Mu transposase C-terminal domain-containing protein [Trichocoleus desertorum]